MFAVLVSAVGEVPTLKFFSYRASARSYAYAQIEVGADQADIYEVPNIDDARKAKAALEMGKGIWLEGRGQRASDKQVALAALAELFKKE
jgi:hypothetical protein